MGVKIREKPKGSGVFWVFANHNGKRTSKKIGTDEDAANEVAKKIEAKLVLGEFNFEKEKPVQTFEQYAEGFVNGFSKINHKPSTHESYKTALDVHIYPVFGEKRLDEIRKKDIKAFLTDKQKEKLAPATVRNLKAYLSCILNQAVDDEIIVSNPASRTGKLIKKTDSTKNIQPLTWAEKELFEKTFRKHFASFYPLFLTLLRTGLRVGEVIALKPGDIDFNGNFIEVRRSCVMGKVTTTKSGKIRRVDMSNGLRKVLKSYLTKRKQEALKKGWGQPPEWLFYNGNGNLFDTSHLRKRIFYKVLEKAGLRHIRIHDLRHTYATLRIQSGHNIADVSKQLGHHSIKITVDTYYHWIPGTGKSEVDQLDGNGVEDNASEAV
jgi:integrase